MKAMKNPVELENIKEAHIKDGVAITKFMYWIKTRYDKEKITELSAADKLTSLRAAQEGYIRDSFEPLCAFADHAAMMHYSPSPESDVELKEGAFFLNDTGGGYYEGSTDITRTFVLGSVDQQMKKYFTAVVRAMMRLSRAKFLYGCYGYNLDVLARGPIWIWILTSSAAQATALVILATYTSRPQASAGMWFPARTNITSWKKAW